MAVSYHLFQTSVQWLVHNSLATRAVLYITGIIGVLIYSYFVTREWF